jgi:hypothetical protein
MKPYPTISVPTTLALFSENRKLKKNNHLKPKGDAWRLYQAHGDRTPSHPLAERSAESDRSTVSLTQVSQLMHTDLPRGGMDGIGWSACKRMALPNRNRSKEYGQEQVLIGLNYPKARVHTTSEAVRNRSPDLLLAINLISCLVVTREMFICIVARKTSCGSGVQCKSQRYRQCNWLGVAFGEVVSRLEIDADD